MNKVVSFTKVRYLMFIISLSLIVGGIAGMFLRGGLNLGIDFIGGYNQQIQFAPVAFSLSYDGSGKVIALIQKGVITLKIQDTERNEEYRFLFSDYDTIDALVNELNTIPGISVSAVSGYSKVSPARLLDTDYDYILDNETGFNVNIALDNASEIFATKAKVTEALAEFGRVSVQTAGRPEEQKFILKIHNQDAMKLISNEEMAAAQSADESAAVESETVEEEIPSTEELLSRQTQNIIENKIKELLAAKFEKDAMLFQQKDYIGSTFSSEISRGAIWSLVLALLLMLAYITIRFKIHFAVGAILALVHDVMIMFGVIGTFQLEVTATTLAAVLTIVGYSLNDTIVVYDRIRENFTLIRDLDKAAIIDTSITQSLSRTIITSLTTLLAVVSIFIFGKGVIKDFAFNLIIGIVVGTYSSIFIASPVVLSWMNVMDKRAKAKQELKIGKRKEPDRVAKVIDEPEKKEIGEAEVNATPAQRTQKKKKKKKKK